MSKKLGTIYLLSTIYCLLFVATPCLAKYTVENAEGFLQEANKGAGVEQTDVITFSGRIVQVGLTAVGLVFFVLVFYAGYRWLTAQGKEESIEKAKNTLIASIIGLMIVVGSYAITNFVVNRLIGGETAKAPVTETGEPQGPLGCCLDEYESQGVWFGAGQLWIGSITDQKTCDVKGNTCEDDQICGSEHWKWVGGVTDEKKCAEMAEAKNTF